MNNDHVDDVLNRFWTTQQVILGGVWSKFQISMAQRRHPRCGSSLNGTTGFAIDAVIMNTALCDRQALGWISKCGFDYDGDNLNDILISVISDPSPSWQRQFSFPEWTKWPPVGRCVITSTCFTSDMTLFTGTAKNLSFPPLDVIVTDLLKAIDINMDNHIDILSFVLHMVAHSMQGVCSLFVKGGHDTAEKCHSANLDRSAFGFNLARSHFANEQDLDMTFSGRRYQWGSFQ